MIGMVLVNKLMWGTCHNLLCLNLLDIYTDIMKVFWIAWSQIITLLSHVIFIIRMAVSHFILNHRVYTFGKSVLWNPILKFT